MIKVAYPMADYSDALPTAQEREMLAEACNEMIGTLGKAGWIASYDGEDDAYTLEVRVAPGDERKWLWDGMTLVDLWAFLNGLCIGAGLKN